jgi:prepilin-type processing-associated H-X9-DG protein
MPDYAGFIPDSFNWVPNNYHTWHMSSWLDSGLLSRYLPKSDVYLCPTFTATYTLNLDNKSGWACTDTLANPPTPVLSYSMNSYLGWTGWNTKPGVTKISGTAMKKPALCLFFGEEDGWIQDPLYATFSINNGSMGYGSPVIGNPTCVDGVASYHFPPGGNFNFGCSNATFVDGHCEKVWNFNNKAMLFDALW